MKTILTKSGHKILVDDEDFDRVNKYKWRVQVRKSDNLYAITSNIPLSVYRKYGGIVCRCRERSINKGSFIRIRYRILLHQLILGKKEGKVIDHINNNGLDNRKENLRHCTNRENVTNQKVGKRNTSGFKGVAKNGNNWRAKLQYKGRDIQLGTYKNKIDAALAYNKAAINYFGEFARINDL